MKIRTDFVTNSSSSSFISYQIDGALLEQVLRHNHLKLKPTGSNFVKISGSSEKMNLQYEGMNSAPSLAQLLIAALSEGNDFDEASEYEKLDRIDTEEDALLPAGTADCTEYDLDTSFDGSDESVAKLIYELYTKTDLFARMTAEKDYLHGGGEDYVEPNFCDFESSGEHIITRNGKIAEYYAHPYLGGFAYWGDEEAFIAYSDGRVSLYDRPMEYDNQSVIWNDKSVAKTLAELADQRVTNGLTWIEELKCEKLEKLLVPECVERILSEALLDCPALEAVYITGYATELGANAVSADVLIVAPEGSAAQRYAEANGNPFMEYDEDAAALEYEDDEEYESTYHFHRGVHWHCYDKNGDYGRYISENCEYIDSGDTALLMMFGSRTVQIEEHSIPLKAVMYGFSGSTAEDYAKRHNIRFYTFDGTDYDAKKLPKNIQIKDGKLCAKGKVFLRLNGLTDKQMGEVKAGEKLEMIPEPDEMNSLRIVFRNAESGEFRGIFAYRAAYTAFYLMKKGYLRFENVVTQEKGYVTADILWEEAFTEQTKQQIHFYQVMQSIEGENPYKYMMQESGFERLFSAAFDVAKMERKAVENTVMTSDIAELYETGNRLALCSAHCTNIVAAGLSTFFLNEQDRYQILSSQYELTVAPATQEILCTVNQAPTALTPAEEEFARIYISQYRKVYNLPPIFTDGGESNATV